MQGNELFKEIVPAGRRIYLIEIKKTKDDLKYLSITELDPANRENQSRKIMVFEDHLANFHKSLRRALRIFEPPKDPTNIPEYVRKVREKFPRAYEKWLSEEDEQLRKKFSEGLPIKDLSALFQRQESSIRSRLKKLNLLREEVKNG